MTTSLPIVVGAHPRAEALDRPLARRLRDLVGAALVGREDAPEPVLCTDLWYLNDDELMRGPAICLGAPDINAATAYLGSRLPTVFVIEHAVRVQLDPDFIDQRACLWGVDAAATETAIEHFAARYLEAFVEGL